MSDFASIKKKTIKPFFPYQGTKRKHLEHIFNYLPKTRELCIDAMGGGGIVSLFLANVYSRVIYNDINEAIVSLFKALKKDPYGIVTKYNKLNEIFTEELFYEYYDRISENIAEEYMIIRNYAFRGGFARMCNLSKDKKTGELSVRRKKNEEVRKIPDNIEFTNSDLSLVLEKFKDTDCFIYIDPPYFSTHTYDVEDTAILDEIKKLFLADIKAIYTICSNHIYGSYILANILDEELK